MNHFSYFTETILKKKRQVDAVGKHTVSKLKRVLRYFVEDNREVQSIIGIVLICHLGINWCIFGFPLFEVRWNICLFVVFFVSLLFLVSSGMLKEKGTCCGISVFRVVNKNFRYILNLRT